MHTHVDGDNNAEDNEGWVPVYLWCVCGVLAFFAVIFATDSRRTDFGASSDVADDAC
jgi:hypothetical protein